MPKTPCPSCGEENFDSDIICWKCGEPLHRPSAGSHVEKTIAFGRGISSPAAVQNVANSDVTQSTGTGVHGRRTVIASAALGAVIGAVVMILAMVVYWKLYSQNDLPQYDSGLRGNSSIGLLYTYLLVIVAAISGAVSAVFWEGEVLGYLIFSILNRLVRYSIGYWFYIRRISLYADTCGYLASLCGFIMAGLVLRKIFQSQSPSRLSLWTLMRSPLTEAAYARQITFFRVVLVVFVIAGLAFRVWTRSLLGI